VSFFGSVQLGQVVVAVYTAGKIVNYTHLGWCKNVNRWGLVPLEFYDFCGISVCG